MAIRIIGTKLRKLLIITWQKILLLFFRVEINFQFTISAQQLSQDSFLLEKQQGSDDTTVYKDWLYILGSHLKIRHSKSHVWHNYMPLRFKESYLPFQSSNFKTSIKENKKSSRFKNFRRSAESWENFW